MESMGNIGVLIVGVILICAVLFIGYKMDTAAERTPSRKAPKQPKAPNKKQPKVKEKHIEEPIDEEEEDDEFYDDVSNDMSYNNSDYSDEEVYESDDFVSQTDLVEDSEYEDEDVSLFSSSNEVESTFNNDIDNELSFETEEPEKVIEEKPKRGRPKKEVAVQEPEDYSSTMIFDTNNLNNQLDEIDKMDDLNAMVDMVGDLERVSNFQSDYSEPDDYSDAVYDIDDKIRALDEDVTEPEKKPTVDGPFQPEPDDAESFMNELKKMQESAEAEDFSGFVVDNKDKELKEVHKKYTKKKPNLEDEVAPISFMPEENKEPEEITGSNSGMDMNFLEQMERNLKDNQKERLSKSKSRKSNKSDDK